MEKYNKKHSSLLQLILFISYKACSSIHPILGKNPFQYRNSIHLITFIIIIHVVQLLCLMINELLIFSLKTISTFQYLILIAVPLLLSYILEFVFSKKVLAKSISRYKGTFFEGKAKPIVWGYVLLNIALLILITYIRGW